MPRFPIRRRAFLLGTGAAVALTPFGLRATTEASPASTVRNHALLVAVTEYPGLFRSEWLEGPNNDALMMQTYLTTEAPVPFAPEDVRVLATGLEIAQGEPTLEAIRAEMARLAEVAQQGDFVMLHFAGHGIEQPARFPDQEVDGRDQVFMPKDVRRMTRALGHWPNGYVDKDIKEDITAIRRKGAFVWAIFDCCHSGTITRALDAVPQGEVSRKIDLKRYDIPPDLWSPSRSRAMTDADLRPRNIFGPAGDVGLETDLGPLVAFFAAQTTEETPELPLPQFAENALQMGLFSFTLLTKLRENPQMSYRRLGQAIHHAYLGMNRARPSPLFEGALDARPFNTAETAPEARIWRISGEGGARAIDAGQMHMLTPGTRLAVLADPTHDLDQALGVVEIRSATALRSQLGPLQGDSDPDLPAIALADIPANAHARVIESVVEFELRVALPDAQAGHEGLAQAVTDLVERIAGDDRLPLRLQLVAADQPADLRLVIRTEAEVADLMQAQGQQADLPLADPDTPRLWLLDTSATLSLRPVERPFSRPLDGADLAPVDNWLRNSLSAIYRATNLARLAQFDDFSESDVQVQVTRLPEFMSPLASGEEIVLHRNSIVRPGNTAHVRVENAGSTPVDVNIVYIASNYAITYMLEAPVRLRAAEPGAPNAVFSEEIVEFDDTSFGRERLLVIVTAAEPQANPLDLSFLEQVGVRALGQTATGFGEMIQTMANATATRGGSSLAARRAAQASQRGAVYVFSVDNVPVS